MILLLVYQLMNHLYFKHGIDNIAGLNDCTIPESEKRKIAKRFQENKFAKKKGFMIYNHGLLYEYRYGFGAFLYVERLQNGLAHAWRANYALGKEKPYKIITVAETTSFSKAFKSAIGFVDWIERRRRSKAG